MNHRVEPFLWPDHAITQNSLDDSVLSLPRSGLSGGIFGVSMTVASEEASKIGMLNGSIYNTGDVDPFLHVSLHKFESAFCESDAMVMIEDTLHLRGRMQGSCSSRQRAA